MEHTKTKHTPGPWVGEKQSFGHGLVFSENNGINIAVINDSRDLDLIAAAPELLEACINSYNLMQKSGAFIDGSPIFKELEAVIAKAEGR